MTEEVYVDDWAIEAWTRDVHFRKPHPKRVDLMQELQLFECGTCFVLVKWGSLRHHQEWHDED